MDTKPLKILLMGDASNCHQTLAEGLRCLGHNITVASSGSGWMNTERDINISRPLPGKAGGLALWLNLKRLLRKELTGFDIVSIVSPGFVELRPERCINIFDELRRRNHRVFMTLLGTDTFYVDECLRPGGVLPFNEWSINGNPAPLALAQPEKIKAWQADCLRELTEHVYSNVAGMTPVLYEYYVVGQRHLPDEKLGYIGIPIDTDAISPVKMPDKIDRVNLFLGRHKNRMLEKGTDILEQAAREVVARHPKHAKLTIVENVPYAKYIELLKSGHIVFDQLYSYTPATNALLAMARGLTTVSGAEEEFYRFINEYDNRPIISADINYTKLVENIEQAVIERDSLAERGRAGRRFVEKHNNYITVAQRAVDFWLKHI